MKKIYTFAVALISAATFAQTPLNTNGSLEDWPDATTAPTGWFIPNASFTNGIVSKQTTGAQDGTNYVQVTAPATSGNNSVALSDITVTPGTSYTIKYWYKGTNINFKHWAQWRTASGNIAPEGPEPFQPADNLPAVAEWTEHTVTSTAPANATILRVAFRNYSGGATLSIDNVLVYDASTASVKEDNIDGLNVYPNPANDIVTIASNGFGAKQVMLFDMLGKKVLETSTNETINVSGLKAGIYVMKITQDGKAATRKLVIK